MNNKYTCENKCTCIINSFKNFVTYKDDINIHSGTFFVMVGVIKLCFVDISSHQNICRMYMYIKLLLLDARGS